MLIAHVHGLARLGQERTGTASSGFGACACIAHAHAVAPRSQRTAPQPPTTQNAKRARQIESGLWLESSTKLGRKLLRRCALVGITLRRRAFADHLMKGLQL